MPAPKDLIKRAEWLANLSAARKGKPSPKKGKTREEICKNPEVAKANYRECQLRYNRENPNPNRPIEVILGHIPLTRNLYALSVI